DLATVIHPVAARQDANRAIFFRAGAHEALWQLVIKRLALLFRSREIIDLRAIGVFHMIPVGGPYHSLVFIIAVARLLLPCGLSGFFRRSSRRNVVNRFRETAAGFRDLGLPLLLRGIDLTPPR